MKLALLVLVSLSGCGTTTGSTSVSRSGSAGAPSSQPSPWHTVLTTEAEVTGVALDEQATFMSLSCLATVLRSSLQKVRNWPDGAIGVVGPASWISQQNWR